MTYSNGIFITKCSNLMGNRTMFLEFLTRQVLQPEAPTVQHSKLAVKPTICYAQINLHINLYNDLHVCIAMNTVSNFDT